MREARFSAARRYGGPWDAIAVLVLVGALAFVYLGIAGLVVWKLPAPKLPAAPAPGDAEDVERWAANVVPGVLPFRVSQEDGHAELTVGAEIRSAGRTRLLESLREAVEERGWEPVHVKFVNTRYGPVEGGGRIPGPAVDQSVWVD